MEHGEELKMDGSCSEKSSDEEHTVVALCDHPLARTTWHLSFRVISLRRGGARASLVLVVTG